MNDVDRNREKKESKLSAERARELLKYDPETGELWWKPGALHIRAHKLLYDRPVGSLGNQGYLRVKIARTTYYAHRVAWLIFHGHWPERDLDHKNLNKSDNRIVNLRAATDAENAANRRGFCGLGMKNIRYRKGAYEVAFRVGEKNVYVGRFKSADDAMMAANKTRNDLYGQFANGSHRHD